MKTKLFLTHPTVRIALAVLAAMLLGHSAQAATYYWSTGTGTWITGANWSDNATSGGTTGVVPGTTDSVVFNQSTVNGIEVVSLPAVTIAGLTFNNTAGTTLNGSGNQNLIIGTGGITLGSGAGAVTIGDATANKNIFALIGADQTWMNNSSSLLTIRNSAKGLTTGTVPVTLTINAAGTGGISDSGALDNGAAGAVVSLVVASTGSGVTNITGGSFSGGTTIKSGILSSTTNFGAGSVLLGDTSASANATLIANHATNTFANNITVQSGNSGTLTISNNGGTNTPTLSGNLTLNKAVTFNAGSTGSITLTGGLSGSGDITTTASGIGFLAFNRGSFTLANNIGGTGGLMQSGVGTLTLTGATGGTTTYAGTTRAANGGTIQLDFNAAGAPASNIVVATSALSLGNGTLSVKGKSTGTSTQTLGNLTLTASSANSIALNNNGGGGTTLTLGNTWTRGAGSTLGIDISAGGTLTSNPTAVANNSVLGFATAKDSTATGFALLSGGNIVRLSGQGALLTTGNVATTNYLQTASGTTHTLSGSQSVNSLEINTAANSGTLNLGAGTLTLTAKGLLLSGTNDYTIENGQLGASSTELIINQLDAGKLTLSATVGGGTGTLTMTGPGTVQIGAGGTTGSIGGTGAVVTGGNLVFDRSNALTVSNAITSQTAAATITQAGAGILTLTGANTNFLGTFNLNANTTTQAGSTSALGAGTLAFNNGSKLSSNSASAYTLNNTAVTINGNISLGDVTNTGTLTVTGAVDLTGAARTIAVAAGNTQVLSGVINNGGITKSGAGTLSLSGSNTYTGGVAINDGVLITNTTGLGTGSVSLGDVTGILGATLQAAGGNSTITNSINVRQGSSGVLKLNNSASGGNTALTFTGSVILNNDLTLTAGTSSGITLSNSIGGTVNSKITISTGVVTLSGVVGANVTDIISNSASTVTISGTNPSFAGSLRVNSGTMVAGQSSVNENVVVYVNSGATFDKGAGGGSSTGRSTIAGVNDGASGGGIVTRGAAGTRPLEIGGSGTYNFSGVLQDNGASLFQLIKTGVGTQTLTGASTYTGSTIIGNGTLKIGVNSVTGNIGSLSGTATAVSGYGGTFSYDGTGSNVVANSQSLGALTFTEGLSTIQSTKGTGTSSTLTFASLAVKAAGATGNIVVADGTNGTNNKVVLTGVTAGSFLDRGLFFNGSNYGYYDSSSYVRGVNYGVDAGSSTTAGGTTIATTTYAQTTAAISAQTSGTFTGLNISSASTADFTLSGSQILTTNGILRSGGGSTTISGGTSVRAASGAELVIRANAAGDSLTINTAIAANGSNALTKDGAGTLTLGAANSYTGLTYVNGGILSVSTNSNLGAEATGAQLNLNNATLQATGSFGLYNGTAGTNNRAVQIHNSGTFDVTGSNTLTVAGVISDSWTATSNSAFLKGYLVKSNSGTLILSGANTYAGATTVTLGTLLINGSTSSASAFSVTGGTLGGSGTIGGAVTVNSGATLAPGNSPGILSTGDLSLSGIFSVDINGTTVGTNYDQVNVTGTVNLVAGNTITMSLGFAPVMGDNFFLIKNDGSDAIVGLLNGYAQDTIFSLASQSWKIGYTGDSVTNAFTGGNDLVLQAVPEPTTTLLLAFALTTVMALRRRTR